MAKIIWKGCPNNLPVQVEYIPSDSSERVYYLAGSAFTRGSVKVGIIGFKATINDQVIVTTEIYSNSEGEHRATVPGMAAFAMPLELKMHEVDGVSVPLFDEDGNLHAKKVIITIDKINNSTITDVNDRLVFAQL